MKKLNLLRIYFPLCLVITSIGLFIHLRTPNEAEAAYFLGFSFGRILVAFPIAIASIVLLIMTIKIWGKSTSEKFLLSFEGLLSRKAIVQLVFYSLLCLFIIGSIIIFKSIFHAEGLVLQSYSERLFPLGMWLLLLSLMTLILMVFWKEDDLPLDFRGLSILIIILFIGTNVHISLWDKLDLTDQDIYYTFLEGQRLLYGENPYERVVAGDIYYNIKYATYLPIFYYFSFGLQRIGFTDFVQWSSIRQFFSLFFNLLITSLHFLIPYNQKYTILAVFSALFWLFNRWNLDVTLSADIDFFAIFFLILSLALFSHQFKKLSLLSLGLSIGIKQMAIFLVPLYMIWDWRVERVRAIKPWLINTGLIIVVPIVASLPFMISNWKGYFKSLLVSVVRSDIALMPSLDRLIGWSGISARIPLLLMICFVYLFMWKLDIKLYSAAAFIMFVFLSFNTIFFPSYTLWFVSLVPLAVYEVACTIRENSKHP